MNDNASVLERRQAVFNVLSDLRNASGKVSNRAVRDAAFTLGVSERTVRRWLAQDNVPTNRRGAWTPTDDDVARLVQDFKGSVQAYRNSLIADGVEVPSLATMHRGFREHTATVQRRWAKGGMQAARGVLPLGTMPDTAVNDEWAVDDTMLPIWCHLPDGTIGKPWMQSVVDTSSRYILSFSASPFPYSAEDAIETLANAVVGHYTDDEVFVGGQPRALRSDRGSIFISEATSLGLVAAGIDRRFSVEYTPEHNGKIERWHRTIKDLMCGIPGFDRTQWKQGDPRKAALPPAADTVLIFEEVLVEVQKRIRSYNFEVIHSAHDMSPAEAWATQVSAQPELVLPGNEAAIRAAMRQTGTRKLRRRRIEWEGGQYPLHPMSVTELTDGTADPETVEQRGKRIDAMEGRDVTIRFLHGRAEWVSVYTPEGEYLGDAVREDLQTPEMAAETAAARRRHIATMKTTLRDIEVRDAAAVAARREEALAVAEEQPESETPPVSTKPASKKGEASKPSSRMEARRKAAEQQRRDDIDAASNNWNFGETA